jgi:hypothetical protein
MLEPLLRESETILKGFAVHDFALPLTDILDGEATVSGRQSGLHDGWAISKKLWIDLAVYERYTTLRKTLRWLLARNKHGRTQARQNAQIASL